MGHNPNVGSEKERERRGCQGGRLLLYVLVTVVIFTAIMWAKSDPNTCISLKITLWKKLEISLRQRTSPGPALVSPWAVSRRWISLDCRTVSHWCHWCLPHLVNFIVFSPPLSLQEAQAGFTCLPWINSLVKMHVNREITFRWNRLIASLITVIFQKSAYRQLSPPANRHLLREDAGWWRYTLNPELNAED